ncbi:MAG: hypothetical protein JWP76_4940, partial [Dactylosporangium sp.]|nr:hypothetical protein [Dactylosporangium sp.]
MLTGGCDVFGADDAFRYVAFLCGEVESVTEVEPLTARPTDLSPLVSAAQSGDEEAFRSLYRAV